MSSFPPPPEFVRRRLPEPPSTPSLPIPPPTPLKLPVMPPVSRPVRHKSGRILMWWMVHRPILVAAVLGCLMFATLIGVLLSRNKK